MAKVSKIRKIIGIKVRDARKERRISQKELAKKTGYSPATISQLESGQFRISLESLAKISQVLKKPITYFLPKEVETFYAIVTGNIGVGKKEIVKKLGKEFEGLAIFENSSQNPYLKNYYEDKKRWALASQLYFLLENFRAQQKITKAQKPVFQDRSLHEQFRVFVTTLFELKIINLRDFQTLQNLYQILVEYVKKPDLLIYLKSNPKILLSKIKKKGESFERKIDLKYLQKLDRKYEEWTANFDICPVLIFDIQKYPLEKPQNFQKLVELIQANL